jgi:para-aminobenzoate synthetase/4-amino-4-deoxychorismate lyase
MEIIRRLEKSPRKVYTGAVGYIAPDKRTVFSVAIRTLVLKEIEREVYTAEMGVGGGIVYDSVPEQEYAECLLKAKFLREAIPPMFLIETMHAGPDGIILLDKHLRRLQTSASFFRIPCALSRIKRDLLAYARKITGSVRIRLLVDQAGTHSIEHKPIPDWTQSERRITLSKLRTNSPNPFLRHKTTFRQSYDREYAVYSAQGFFDVIFCNERGEVTEGAITNIFVKIDGLYYTPPVSCGLLPGIQRQLFMMQNKVLEKVLYPTDLERAEELLLTNALRGVIPVSYRKSRIS